MAGTTTQPQLHPTNHTKKRAEKKLALCQGSQRVLGFLVFATYDQLFSVEQREQAISATDGPAAFHMPEIDKGAAVNPYKTHWVQTCLKLLQRRANPVAQSPGMHFNVVGS